MSDWPLGLKIEFNHFIKIDSSTHTTLCITSFIMLMNDNNYNDFVINLLHAALEILNLK